MVAHGDDQAVFGSWLIALLLPIVYNLEGLSGQGIKMGFNFIEFLRYTYANGVKAGDATRMIPNIVASERGGKSSEKGQSGISSLDNQSDDLVGITHGVEDLLMKFGSRAGGESMIMREWCERVRLEKSNCWMWTTSEPGERKITTRVSLPKRLLEIPVWRGGLGVWYKFDRRILQIAAKDISSYRISRRGGADNTWLDSLGKEGQIIIEKMEEYTDPETARMAMCVYVDSSARGLRPSNERSAELRTAAFRAYRSRDRVYYRRETDNLYVLPIDRFTELSRRIVTMIALHDKDMYGRLCSHTFGLIDQLANAPGQPPREVFLWHMRNPKRAELDWSVVIHKLVPDNKNLAERVSYMHHKIHQRRLPRWWFAGDLELGLAYEMINLPNWMNSIIRDALLSQIEEDLVNGTFEICDMDSLKFRLCTTMNINDERIRHSVQRYILEGMSVTTKKIINIWSSVDGFYFHE